METQETRETYWKLYNIKFKYFSMVYNIYDHIVR